MLTRATPTACFKSACFNFSTLAPISPEASLNLLERAEGNIFNLSGTDIDMLTDIDGVGPATGARLIVLFALIAQYESWQSA